MMAQIKAKELRGMPEPELRQKIDEARNDLMTMRLKASQASLEQPHKIQMLRRDVARMMTVLSEQSRQRADKSGAR